MSADLGSSKSKHACGQCPVLVRAQYRPIRTHGLHFRRDSRGPGPNQAACALPLEVKVKVTRHADMYHVMCADLLKCRDVRIKLIFNCFVRVCVLYHVYIKVRGQSAMSRCVNKIDFKLSCYCEWGKGGGVSCMCVYACMYACERMCLSMNFELLYVSREVL